MYPTAEVIASIAFGVIMVLLSLVSIYQAAMYAARVKCGLPPVCYELEAGPAVLGVPHLARRPEAEYRLDLVGVGSWSATTLHGIERSDDKNEDASVVTQDQSDIDAEQSEQSEE